MRPNEVIKVLGRPTLYATALGAEIVEQDSAIWAFRSLHTMADCYYLRRVQTKNKKRSEVVSLRLTDIDARWNRNAMAILFARGGIPLAYYCTRSLRRDIRDGYMPSDTLALG